MPYKNKEKHADYMQIWRKKKKAQIERALDALWEVSPSVYLGIFEEPRHKPKLKKNANKRK